MSAQRRGLAHHLEFFFGGQVVDHDFEHETVELGFRQRVGALELDRVLRREHEEGFFEIVGFTLHRDPVFLHRLEQRRLGFRRRAVDFVGEHDVGEDRSRQEVQLALAGLRDFPAPGRCR